MRVVPSNEAALRTVLGAVFDEVESGLLAIAKEAVSKKPDSRIVRFCSSAVPRLRLITGLAEGADQLAAIALGERAKTEAINRELAAVLPCSADAYRASREAWHLADFEALISRCAYVLELDGICEKPNPETTLSKTRRERAYRAQGAFLLRHCDVLLAMADLSEPGRAGGTLDTVTRALAFQLPVVLIDTKTGNPHLLEPNDDLSDVLGRPPAQDWRKRLRDWVTLLAAGPDTKAEGKAEDKSDRVRVRKHREHEKVDDFLDEFFAPLKFPPKDAKGIRKPSRRELFWSGFADSFHTKDSKRKLDGPIDRTLEPFAQWRKRATELNYQYTGLYRGAFIVNYALAVVAVSLATLSLVLIAMFHPEPPSEAATNALTTKLLVLGFLKLLCIVAIFFNTRSANSSGWNQKAIDYRYLSERLRCAFYLPTIGSVRPPVPAKAQFTSRVLRQSTADWLFEAMMRHVSPTRIEALRANASNESPAGDSRLLRVRPSDALDAMRRHWIATQLDYHLRNALHMESMHHHSERIGGNLNLFVIFAVLVDLVVLVYFLWAEPLGLPHWPLLESMHHYAPVIISLAAILPALVASLNGVRFQSECLRLSDRSDVMVDLLDGNEKRGKALAEEIDRNVADLEIDLGSWSADVLNFAEFCGRELVEEATEWSVLYAKEIHET